MEELRRKAREVEELREQLLRARADFANFRKRHQRDMEEFRRYALQDFVASLLPGLDDLERALKAEDADLQTLREGVRMALETLKKALRDAGVEQVATHGEPFDPTVHDALVVETHEDLEAPTVAEEIRAGYRLGDRLVRPAQVKVMMPPSRDQASAEEDQQEPSPASETPDRPEGENDADL